MPEKLPSSIEIYHEKHNMANSDAVIVMGPDANSNHIHYTHLLTPPSLTQDTDRTHWREVVCDWIQLPTAQKGEIYERKEQQQHR